MSQLIDFVRNFFCNTPVWFSIPLAVLAIILYIGAGKTVNYFLLDSFITLTKMNHSGKKHENEGEEKDREAKLTFTPTIVIIAWPIVLTTAVLLISFAVTIILAVIALILFLAVAIILLIALLASAIIIGVPAFVLFVIAVFTFIIIVFIFLLFIAASAYESVKMLAVDIPKAIFKIFRKSPSGKPEEEEK